MAKFPINADAIRILENWAKGPFFENRAAQKESLELLEGDSTRQVPHETAEVAAAWFQIENWSMAHLWQKMKRYCSEP